MSEDMDRIRKWVNAAFPTGQQVVHRPSWHQPVSSPTTPRPGLDEEEGVRMVELFGKRGYYWARRNGQLTLRRRRFTPDDVDRSFVDHPAGRHQPGSPKAVLQLGAAAELLVSDEMRSVHDQVRQQIDQLVRDHTRQREERMVGGRRAYDLLTAVLRDAGLMGNRPLTPEQQNEARLLWDLVVHGQAFVDANDTRVDPLLVTGDRDGWTATLDGQTAVVDQAPSGLRELVVNAQVRATPPKLPASTSADVPPAGDPDIAAGRPVTWPGGRDQHRVHRHLHADGTVTSTTESLR